jgi:hypothetical protein
MFGLFIRIILLDCLGMCLLLSRLLVRLIREERAFELGIKHAVFLEHVSNDEVVLQLLEGLRMVAALIYLWGLGAIFLGL